MKRKSSKNFSRRPRPLQAPGNTFYAGAVRVVTMAALREYLKRRRENKNKAERAAA